MAERDRGFHRGEGGTSAPCSRLFRHVVVCSWGCSQGPARLGRVSLTRLRQLSVRELGRKGLYVRFLVGQ
eukprot:2031623-Alexandrium_andersonii.AAC.1